MDDFRVGSVPPAEPYDDRRPYSSISRKRPKHRDDEHSDDQEAHGDTFEATTEGEEPSPEPDELVEDYYLPSEPGTEAE